MKHVAGCFHDTKMNRWQYQPIQKRDFVVTITVTTTLNHPHNIFCFCSIEGKAPSPSIWPGLLLSVHSSDSHHPQSLFDICVFHTGVISGSAIEAQNTASTQPSVGRRDLKIELATQGDRSLMDSTKASRNTTYRCKISQMQMRMHTHKAISFVRFSKV